MVQKSHSMKTTTAIEATIDKLETMKDNTIKMRLYTQELSAGEKLSLFNLQNKLCYAVFAHSDVSQLVKRASELRPPKVEAKGKSPSQRLRAVLYVRFEQEGHTGDFDSFYNAEMEKMIERQKDFLK